MKVGVYIWGAMSLQGRTEYSGESRDVHAMFAGIAGRYDLANDVLSFGVHRRWRNRAVEFVGVEEGEDVLDLCTGTGDLAFCLAERVGGQGSVTGVDFVAEMLLLAEEKREGREAPVRFLQSDALALPFSNQSFDVVTTSFGIRNVEDTSKCLRESLRVLRPGGRLLVLEFGQPRWPVFSEMYRIYGKYIMPRIGGMLTGDRRAYEYLPRTASQYPDDERFLDLMREAGFAEVRALPFFSGVAYAYVGTRAESN